MTTNTPFPPGFLWGTAISAHQSEGNNVASDAWLCENISGSLYHEPSRDACDSYHRYGEDIAIAAGLGLNCYRMGIEWARIEPEPGLFSQAALDHYRRVLDTCHAHGLAPMITFNHFTVPRWFAARGGFEVADSAALFARFAERATARLGDLIGYASTFNEANIPRLISLFFRRPGADRVIDAMLATCARACQSDRFSSLLFVPYERTEAALLEAHALATAAMKAGPGEFPVGVTLSMQDVQAADDSGAALAFTDTLYGPWLDVARGADFIGVQTYTRIVVGRDGVVPPPADAELTAAGYEFYPPALGACIRFAADRIRVPIIVTESGIATDDDSRRIAFVDAAVGEVRQALADGLDVRGFIYWSLLDNFEWTRGYGEHFGLVGVDLTTFARTPKPSAAHLQRIIAAAS